MFLLECHEVLLQFTRRSYKPLLQLDLNIRQDIVFDDLGLPLLHALVFFGALLPQARRHHLTASQEITD